MLKDRPSVNQLKKKYGTNGFFLTTLLPNRIKCVAIKQEFICKEKDGYMCIYKLAEVAKYKILKGE